MTRSIALVATFTLDQIAAEAAQIAESQGISVVAAPYGQVTEALLDPGSALLAHSGVSALLLRLEDLRGGLLDEVLAALGAAPLRSGAIWLVALTPPSPRALGDPLTKEWLGVAQGKVVTAIDALPGVHLMAIDQLAQMYSVTEVHDEYADRIAHVPYTDSYSNALSVHLVRLASSVWRPPVKVIVLDCDNTLWAGVCGEDGPLGVTVDDGHDRVQRFLLDQRSAGKLLCLCSRNNESDVHKVFTDNAGMVLSQDDITASRIGWGSKAGYVEQLSTELGLKLSSFVFVDDDAVECAAMRDQSPDVTVVEIDRDGDRAWHQLIREPAFDQLTVTTEDRQRPDWYAAESERRSLRESTADYEDFLTRCRVEVSLDQLDETTLERAAQLTARTTQFTLNGTARSVPELRAFLQSGGTGRVVRVRDAFGDYGVVGLVLSTTVGLVVEVPAFLLSCRMINRRVDIAVLGQLCAEARAAGHRTVRFHHRPTERNLPARQFLEQVGGTPIQADDRPGHIEVAVAEWL